MVPAWGAHYIPFFGLIPITDEYFHALIHLSGLSENAVYLEIPSKEPLSQDQLLAKRIARMAGYWDEHPARTDFLQAAEDFQAKPENWNADLDRRDFVGWSVEQVYEFYKKYWQEPPHTVSNHDVHWSAFSFIAVDEACMQTQPWQCIIGCDAPDFGEPLGGNTIKLKEIRVNLPDLGYTLWKLEHLLLTPMEAKVMTELDDAGRDDFRRFRQAPPAIFELLDHPGENGKWSWQRATPFLARITRKRAIRVAEDAGLEIGKGRILNMYGILSEHAYKISWEDY